MISPHARDYRTVIDRLAALSAKRWQTRIMGVVSGFPSFAVESRTGPADQTVLLTGGVHGDEPAGVEAVLRWLEQPPPEAGDFRWLVIPCVNPFGWTHDRRTNSKCRDINRNFRAAGCCRESGFVRTAVTGRRFVFAMDFHEDGDAPGYYICEIKSKPPFAGERVITAVRSVLPIWKSRRLDGRQAVAEGCVRRFPATDAMLARRRSWPMEFFLLHRHTEHTFCSETPTRPSLDLRVLAHHTALREALRFAKETRRSADSISATHSPTR